MRSFLNRLFQGRCKSFSKGKRRSLVFHGNQFRPRIDCLEGRLVPTTVYWINPKGGDWSIPENWDTGVLPRPEDDVVIGVPGNVTITHTIGSDSVQSLTSRNNMAITGGALELATASTLNNLDLSGGTLGGAGQITVNGLLRWTDGTLAGFGRTVANGGLEISGPGKKMLFGRGLENRQEGIITGGTIFFQLGGNFSNAEGANLVVTNGVFQARDDLGGFFNGGYIRVFQGMGVGASGFDNDGLIEVYSGGLGMGSRRAQYSNRGSIRLWDATGTLGVNADTFVSTGSILGSGGVNINCLEGTSISGEFHVEGNAFFESYQFNSHGNFYVGGSLSFLDQAYLDFSDSIVQARSLDINSTLNITGDFYRSTLFVPLEINCVDREGGNIDFVDSTIHTNTLNYSAGRMEIRNSTFTVRSFTDRTELLMEQSTSSIRALEGVHNRGWMRVEGLIDGDLNNEGIVDVGMSGLVVTGNFTQSSGASLTLFLNNPGQEGDPLQIGGNARLDGFFAAFPRRGYKPMEGDILRGIAIGGATIGNFSRVDLPTFQDGLYLEMIFDGSSFTFVVRRREA